MEKLNDILNIKCPNVIITMGKNKYKALIRTGGAHNMMSYNVFKQSHLEVLERDDDQNNPANKTVYFTYIINGVKFYDKAVVEYDLEYDMILGYQWMIKNEVSINYGDKSISINKYNIVEYFGDMKSQHKNEKLNIIENMKILSEQQGGNTSGDCHKSKNKNKINTTSVDKSKNNKNNKNKNNTLLCKMAAKEAEILILKFEIEESRQAQLKAERERARAESERAQAEHKRAQADKARAQLEEKFKHIEEINNCQQNELNVDDNVFKNENKINDQQGGDISKDINHNDKTMCNQQNKTIVVDNQNKNKFNIVMNNHNNQNDKINCNQQNKLNFVENICENKSVSNVVDKIHNQYIDATKGCHANELNFVHNNHQNHVEEINKYHQIICDNNICKNNANNNNLSVAEKKMKVNVFNNKYDNNIGKVNTGQRYKLVNSVNNKIKNKIKCKIKYKHLINNNNMIGRKCKFDGKFGCKRYLGHLEMFADFNLTSQLRRVNAELLWLMSFASCQGPGGILLMILIQITSMLYIVYNILEVKCNNLRMDATITICWEYVRCGRNSSEFY